MKMLLGFLATSLMAVSFLSAAPEMKNCKCKNCACTQEKHCGCLSGSGCQCGENCKCGENCIPAKDLTKD